ncbi:MAG: GldG family protein [Ruminococcus sp.]|nr:GldG family protein [Ruminococcus sp.]
MSNNKDRNGLDPANESEENINTSSGENTGDTGNTSGGELLDIVKKQREGKLSSDKEEKPADSDPDSEDEAPRPKKEKKKANIKTLKHGMMSTVLTLVFIAAVVLVNVIATVIFERYPLTLDLTQEKRFSISDQSVDYVKGINVDVLITVFATEENFDALSDYTRQASEVIKKFKHYNDRISYRYVDMDSNPDIIAEYGTDAVMPYNIMFETNPTEDVKRTRNVSLLDLVKFKDEFVTSLNQYYGTDISGMLNYYGGSDIRVLQTFGGYVEASRADEAFTSALMAVTDPNPTTAVFLTGRKELDTLPYLHSLLEANGYQVKDIDITKEDIPEEATVVIIPAPAEDYLDTEVKKLSDYLDNGGKMGKQMLYAASASQPETKNLDEFLEEWGIKIGKGVICEQKSEMFYMRPYYTVSDYVSDNFTQDMTSSSFKLINVGSRPISLLFDERNNNGTEAYVTSSEDAVVLDISTGEQLAKGKQTYVAVASKAVFSTEDGSGTYSNIIVYGSAESLSDSYLSYTQFGNREYVLSLLNGTTHKTSTGITIEPKVITGNVFDLTDAQSSALQWTFTLIIPVIVLIIGGVIWLRRKNR